MVTSGVVEAVYVGKPFGEGKAWGPKVHLDLKINGEKYRLSFQVPGAKAPVKQGDVVELDFTSEQNGQYTNHMITKDSLKVLESGAEVRVKPVAMPAAAPMAVDNRQKSIVFQSSLKVAIEMMKHNKKGTEIKLEGLLVLSHDIMEVALDPDKLIKVKQEPQTHETLDESIDF